jgi:hypothetical protein
LFDCNESGVSFSGILWQDRALASYANEQAQGSQPWACSFACEPDARVTVYTLMAVSRSFPTESESAGASSTLAKPLAPEEVHPGDFVTVLYITYELPSFLWCADSFRIPHDEPVRLQFLPEDGGAPLKVRAVCLPFVLVKTSANQHRTLDLRKCRIARLDPEFAKTAWKAGKKKQMRTSPTCI